MTDRVQRAFIAVVAILSFATASNGQLLPERETKPKKPTTPRPNQKEASPETEIRVTEPEMVRIPAGEFRMGSESGREDEKPVHRVYISEFYISKYAVSNTEYKVFVDATGHRPPASKDKERPLWSGKTFPAEIARQPVVKVSWDDAVAYCVWLSGRTGKLFRLPSEAEWEKAACGGLEQKKYPWGDDDPDDSKAWFGKAWNGLLTLKDVDYGAANAYGLYGLAGNAYQWVADFYNGHYYVRSSLRDPQGAFDGLHRVVRGGSAFDKPERIRCAAREFRLPGDRLFEVGIRVLRK